MNPVLRKTLIQIQKQVTNQKIPSDDMVWGYFFDLIRVISREIVKRSGLSNAHFC